MIDTNIKGLIHTTMEVLPLLKDAGRGASIVNVGSVAQRWAYPGGNVYGGTKAFVHQFSHNLRADLAGNDIRVTTLEPGLSKSEFTLVRTGGDAGANEKMYEGVEPILPEDIADIVWFLANQPPHINISILEVDAGDAGSAGRARRPQVSRPTYPFDVRSRDVWRIALPASVAFITEPLAGLVDITVIGRLGDAALLGGLVIGALVFDFIFSLAYFLRIGTAGLTAQAIGARDPRDGLLHVARAIAHRGADRRRLMIALQVPLLWLANLAMAPAPGVREGVRSTISRCASGRRRSRWSTTRCSAGSTGAPTPTGHAAAADDPRDQHRRSPSCFVYGLRLGRRRARRWRR